MNRFTRTFTRIKKSHLILYSVLALLCIGSMVFVFHNDSLYDRPIAKVTGTVLAETEEVTDPNGNGDRLFTQQITAELQNGSHRSEEIRLTNTYSDSKAFDQEYKTGDELFVSIDADNTQPLTGDIQDVKRDRYMMGAFWVFVFILTIVGRRKGLFAVLSLGVNIALLALAIEVYVRTGANLLVLAGILSILFTVLSLLFINGFNGKTYAAIVATLLGTFASLAITLLVMRLTTENGLHYEEMQFLTRPYRMVFIAGLFIGSLGAVMDVAITMSSSIFELWEKNPAIPVSDLKASARDIGRDIMGTMSSILFFAYISGAIPMLVLYLKNASSLGFTLSINLSLELVRALSGGIGIVLAIPIGIWVSIYFVKRRGADA